MRTNLTLIAALALTATMGTAVTACASSDAVTGGTPPTDTSTTAETIVPKEETSGTTGQDTAPEPKDTGTADTGGGGADVATDATADAAPDVVDAGTPAACAKGKGCYNGKCCTCFPDKKESHCEQGIDNSLSGIASLANSQLQGSVDEGQVNLLAEFVSPTLDGKEFTLNMYTGDLDPSNDGKDGDTICDVTAPGCKWTLADINYDKDCKPLIAFQNAKITSGKLTAGGPDGVFRLSIPIQGFNLDLLVTMARIEADVTLSKDGKSVEAIAGILAGAVPKKSIEDAVAKLGDKLPISPDAVKQILTSVVKEDIDGLGADGNPGKDGKYDSSSIAIKFEGVLGTITMVEVKPVEPPKDADAGSPPPPPPEMCKTYPTTFSPSAYRLTKVGLGENAKAGNGLDVDGICVEPDGDPGVKCPVGG